MKEKIEGRVLTVFLALALFLPVFYFSFLPWPGGDDVHYLMLAKSIVERNRYLDLYLPEEPAHTQYPPGWPLILSPFALFFKDPLIPAKSFVVILSFITILLGFRLFQSLADPWLGLGAFIMLFLNVSYLKYSTHTLSDLLFLLLVMLYVFLVSKEAKGRSPSGYRLPLFLSVIAFYVRTAGIALFLGHIFYTFSVKKRRALVESVLIGIPVILLWPIRNLLLMGSTESQRGYISSFLLKNPTLPDAGKAGYSDLLERPLLNLYIFVKTSLPDFFLPRGGQDMKLLFGIVLTFLLLFGIANLKKRKALNPFLPFLVLYLAIYLMWPKEWNERRFLLPIMPVLVVMILDGARFILHHTKRSKRFLPLVLSLIFAIFNLSYIGTSWKPLWQKNVFFLKEEYNKIPDSAWSAFLEGTSWATENTDEEAIIFVRKPRLFAYFSKRHSKSYPSTFDKEKMWSSFGEYGDRTEYLVYSRRFSGDRIFLRRFLMDEENKRHFKPVFRSSNRVLFVLELMSFPGPQSWKKESWQ